MNTQDEIITFSGPLASSIGLKNAVVAAVVKRETIRNNRPVTKAEIGKECPFFTDSQIRSALQDLQRFQIIVGKRRNTHRFDSVKIYDLSQSPLH